MRSKAQSVRSWDSPIITQLTIGLIVLWNFSSMSSKSADFTDDGINIKDPSVRGRDVVDRITNFIYLSVSLSLENPSKVG